MLLRVGARNKPFSKSAQKWRQLRPGAVISTTMKTDPRVDAYIAQAPPFAQAILQEARARIGKACPSAEETIKWNVPFFLLGDKILASMAAFKKHVKVGVWTGMMPKFADVSEVEELPPSKDFTQQLQAAAKAIDGAMTSKPTKDAPAKPAKKSVAKEATEKKAVAKEAPAKKAVASEAREKKVAKETPAKNAPAKKAPANKSPANKSPANKSPAKKAPAKQASAKKAVAKQA